MNTVTIGERTAIRDDFESFVGASSPALLRTAWLMTGDPHAAEEIVQEALARLFPKWERIASGQPLAYSRRIVVNLVNDGWHRRRREVLTAETPDRASPTPTAVEDRDLLIRLLSGLPPRERQVVVLRHYDDLSEQQVADVLGISVGTVKSTAHKGLTTLRTRYAALGMTS
ncbi:SigE family RNA polymerase sigma factor [Calidifontibacter terrae]